MVKLAPPSDLPFGLTHVARRHPVWRLVRESVVVKDDLAGQRLARSAAGTVTIGDAGCAAAAAPARDEIPLVVDLEGTLLMTDLLHEAALQLVARNPLHAFLLPIWLAQGRGNLEARLADQVDPGIDSLPLRPEVVVLIRAANAAGRRVFLTSDSDNRQLQTLADRLGGVADVFGTPDCKRSLAGEAKAARLVEAFGARGYDYVGNSAVDFPVWRSARKVMVVAHSEAFAAGVLRAFPDAEIVAKSRLEPRSYLQAMRLHQWAKNILVFLPMVGGHRFDPPTTIATFIAFFSFSFAASSAYVLNDLLDLPGDRRHPRKACRPFAAGKAPITHGLLLSALLMVCALGLAALLPGRFIIVLLIYIFGTLSYSLVFMRKVLIDVIILGGLYTIRVYGGLAAVNHQQTQWLLMFSLFLFLSLALVKRCSELVARRSEGRFEVVGRGYRVEDLGVLLPLGAAAGYGAVFVVTLYLSSPEVTGLYRSPHRLWLMCPLLLYWISRMILMSHRGELHHDPVVFALGDRTSWITAVLVAGVIAVSI